MLVRNDYDILTVQHTLDETDDPDSHVPQEMTAEELIIHAANLYLMRCDPDGRSGQPLWSLRANALAAASPRNPVFRAT
jgi:hypothetical protein